MIDLSLIIKDCVNSVTKSAEFIYVLIADDTIVIDTDDTSLSVIPLGMSTGVYSGFSYPGDYITGNNRAIFNYVTKLWERYYQLSTLCVVEGCIPDLRSIPEYERLLNLKADEGGGFFKMPGNELYNNFIIPVFTGLPIINKQDKIGIAVKRIDRTSLLVEYHIWKKKLKTEFTLYFRTCDMNRLLLEEQFKIW